MIRLYLNFHKNLLKSVKFHKLTQNDKSHRNESNIIIHHPHSLYKTKAKTLNIVVEGGKNPKSKIQSPKT